MPAATTRQLLETAQRQLQAGRVADAEDLYHAVLQSEPENPDALHMMGITAFHSGVPDAALALVSRGIWLNPSSPYYHCTRGQILAAIGRVDDAIVAYREALAIREMADVLACLGEALRAGGRLTEAAAVYRRLIALDPNRAEAHFQLGSVLQDSGRIVEAAALYHRALSLRSDHADAANNLGTTLTLMGRPDQAMAAFSRAIAIRPDFSYAHNNLGNVLASKGRPEEAARAFHTAIRLKPDFHLAHGNLGTALSSLGQLDDAIASFRQAIALEPGDWVNHSNLLYTLQYHPGYEPAAIVEAHRQFDRQHAQPLSAEIRPHETDRTPGRRLRIGYVSPNFWEHCQSFFMHPLLAAHDPEQVEVFCYCDVASPDAVTQRLRSHGHTWRNIFGMSDAKVAEMIRADKIDILVDLTMHMEKGRPLLFARKPASIQVAWLAYPGTTGLSAIDYRLTDPYLDPPGMHDDRYSERSIRLSDTFWCYEPFVEGLEPNSLPALTARHVTFGCLNNFCKVNEHVLAVWSQVLRRVKGSRLLMLAPPGTARTRVLEVMGRNGVSSDRIDFVPLQSRVDYLRTYYRIDICLDTFPYNGHTTSLDSYWMGVPVVTLVGPTVVGRAGWSQLNNLDLTELSAQTPQQFIETASSLASDLSGLAQVRRTLRDRLRQSPLMNGERFARSMEQAFGEIWVEFCRR